MNRNKKSFLLHIDSLDILDELTDEQAGLLFKAIKAYQKSKEIELDAFVRIAFSPFKNQFTRDNEKYDTTCKRRAEAGRLGGEAKQANASKSKQKVASASKCKEEVANLADSNSKNKTNNKSDSKSDKDITTLSAKANLPYEIFTYWKDVMKKNSNSQFTTKRMKVVKDRLKEGYTVEQIKLAIYGCSITPHNNGTDPQGNGQRYDGLELICKSGENVERFAGNTQQSKLSNGDEITTHNVMGKIKNGIITATNQIPSHVRSELETQMRIGGIKKEAALLALQNIGFIL